MICFTLRPCYDSDKVARSSNIIGVEPKVTQYVFQIENLSKDPPSFHRHDWLKNKNHNEAEILCSMSRTKHSKYEWGRLWSMKLMRRALFYEVNVMKVTRQMSKKDYFYWRHSSRSTLSILWLYHTRKKTLIKIKTMILYTNVFRAWWNISYIKLLKKWFD